MLGVFTRKLDSAWGNGELAKPFDECHPIMQWYQTYCKYQQSVVKAPSVVHSSPITDRKTS
ncbi:hypothetical protein DPM33_19030 [Mesorhizobium hawassense]|uniref:Uncharacterized protein n=1 Tax=Mesorhizobium hawassense TaxID=1209954 RepID=A0A330HWI4_9HYPH|nr:hypothetical protein [Mesorhizobium hawassense]RAZ89067.1 hypothetical protein DPM33_19030 [Mesorhizobium hawassense]